MSDRFYNRLTVKATSEKDHEQLKRFISKSKGQDETFSFHGTIPNPYNHEDNTDNQSKWAYKYWGVKYDVWDTQIIKQDSNSYIVEFLTNNGVGKEWMKNVSQLFPDLLFSNLYYLEGIEGAIEGQNGLITDHDYPKGNDVEITSNYFQDYEKYSKLTPMDSNGKPYPFEFIVINSDRILIRFLDKISEEQGRRVFGAQEYRRFFEMNLYKIRNERLICLPVDSIPDNNSLYYSIILNCIRVDDAISESLRIMKEFHKPIDDFIVKIIDIAKSDFNIRTDYFEFEKVVLPSKN